MTHPSHDAAPVPTPDCADPAPRAFTDLNRRPITSHPHEPIAPDHRPRTQPPSPEAPHHPTRRDDKPPNPRTADQALARELGLADDALKDLFE